MPCTGLPLSAPNISCLDYLLHWDLSGATPIVTITNNSTVSNYANLKWWFYVVSPNGAALYGVDLTTVSPLPTPDVTGVSWTTKVITMATPFGNPPCGQIEFSPTNPYNVYVYAQDITLGATTFFTYNKNTLLTRPNGNTKNSCGNFGTAAVGDYVNCPTQTIQLTDSTNLIYNNILTPISSSNKWTLVYPQDASGDVPNISVNNQVNINLPLSVNSDGYVLYFNQTATYDYGNGVTVTVQYKLFSADGSLGRQFSINCNTNLCLLSCQMQEFYKLSKGACGTLENATLQDKMVEITFLFQQIWIGCFQPLCGVDVPWYIKQIQKILGTGDNCGCNCNGNNFGFSNMTGNGGSVGGCCPIYTGVTDIGTGNPPLNCPNGYFPANVYDPTGVTVIGNATSIGDEIAIINANAAWQQYGTAFDAGNCKVGFFPASGVTVIPHVIVDPNGGGSGGGATVIVDIIDPCGYPPASCPAGYFPAQVYNPTGATIIGIASDINSLVGIINAYGGWQAVGMAFVVDNCHVGFYPKPGVTVFPEVVVTYGEGGCSGTTTGCVNGRQTYPVTINDICVSSTPPITSSSFPLNVYVNFGAGPVFVGNAANQAAMIADLNAAPGKPTSVTFSAGATVSQVIVNNSNCTNSSSVVSITADAGSNNFLLFGGNHTNLLYTPMGENNEFAFGIKSLSRLGRLTGSNFPWHTIKLGNVLLATQPDSGRVFMWDITNPLMPSSLPAIALTATVMRNFTGLPQSETIASAVPSPGAAVDSQYSLYFPTDFTVGMTADNFYVVESLTGTIWQLTGYFTGSAITQNSFQDDRLIGKCPRVLIGGKLYLTQDGNLEQATGQSSGVDTGDIVILDITDFGTGGITTQAIFSNKIEHVWAASYNGAGIIYFTGEFTSVASYDVATATPTVYPTIAGAGIHMAYRANTTFFNGLLYIVAQHMPTFNGIIVDPLTLSAPGYTLDQFEQPTSAHMDGMFNFTPLGNCLGILTSAAIASDSPAIVGLYKTDGTYLASIPLAANEEFFNVVAVGNVLNTTPNNYLPAP